MEQLLPLIYLFVFLAAGILAGRIGLVKNRKIMQILVSVALYSLLFFMGFRIGRNSNITGNLASIGLLSLSYAAASVLGTIAVLIPALLVINRKRGIPKIRKEAEKIAGNVLSWHHFRGPFRLLCAVLAGFFIGLISVIPYWLTGENLSTWLLYFLILLIGEEISHSGIDVGKVLKHPETLILPAGTILGSLAGGAVLAIPFGISFGKSLALSAGFGWYSLSGVIITNLGDPVLGSAGFIANMLREGIALVSIPFLARTPFPLAGIGIAGATSMDVTLPLIERTCGPESVPLAIVNGAILSLLVPVLVPFFFQLG